MKKLDYYEVIVTYDTDQKISVWYRQSVSRRTTLGWFRLKEGSNEPEQTRRTDWFAHDSKKKLDYKKVDSVLKFEWSYESADMIVSAFEMIRELREKTVSYCEFLSLQKRLKTLEEFVKSRLNGYNG